MGDRYHPVGTLSWSLGTSVGSRKANMGRLADILANTVCTSWVHGLGRSGTGFSMGAGCSPCCGRSVIQFGRVCEGPRRWFLDLGAPLWPWCCTYGAWKAPVFPWLFGWKTWETTPGMYPGTGKLGECGPHGAGIDIGMTKGCGSDLVCIVA